MVMGSIPIVGTFFLAVGGLRDEMHKIRWFIARVVVVRSRSVVRDGEKYLEGRKLFGGRTFAIAQ